MKKSWECPPGDEFENPIYAPPQKTFKNFYTTLILSKKI